MNWFAWRQHRKQCMIFGVILLAFTVFTVLTGNHYWHTYQHALTACTQHPENPSCSDLSTSLPESYGATLRTVLVTGLAVPLVLGLFLGLPLLSKEYEEGTNKLVWTQSVSRRKWLTTKLVWALLFAALYGLAISLLVSWWARVPNALEHSRFDAGQFNAEGIMPFAYSVFFTALGFALSAWFRKTLIALAITLVLFIGFQVSFSEWIRAHYMTPVTVTAQMGPGAIDRKIPTGAWQLSRSIVDKNGKAFDSFDIPNMPPECQQIIQAAQVTSNGRGGVRVKAAPGGGDPLDDCLNKDGYHQVATYQPSYRYWDFQRTEAGIYLGMAALAIGATYWLVLRRDA